MTLEHHVTNLELSKKLKDLGVPQKSTFVYDDEERCIFLADEPQRPADVSAFLASELFEQVKGFPYLSWGYIPNQYVAQIVEKPHTQGFMADTLVDALAKLLVHLIEKKIVDPKTL